MLGEGDGLSPLQVGIAGHHGLLMLGSRGIEDLEQVQQHLPDLGDLLPQIEPQIHSHLVVAAAGRVEPLAGVADALGQQDLPNSYGYPRCRR